MIRVALALALGGWMFTFARRSVAAFLPNEQDRLTAILAAAGFGVGLMTLTALGVMLTFPGGPAVPIAFAASAALYLASLALPRSLHRTAGGSAPTARPGPRRRTDPLAIALQVAIVSSSIGILFNAVSWPFESGDALALYAPFGRHIYETATLPAADGLYAAYPMLVPIAYAFAYSASGSLNEYLARLVPALMALGVVGVAGALASDMGSRRAGLTGAALVALTPVFGRWASSGYADLPAAMYVGLAALFAWRWWESGHRRALVLCGLSAGLACWTKNSALTILPGLAAILIARHSIEDAGDTREPHGSLWRNLAILAGPVLLTAGPWYARNLVVFDLIVPPTAFVDRAQRTMASLGVMLRSDQHFGLPGWLFTAALVYGAVAMVVRTGRRPARWFVLLAFIAPFLAAWWWFASYDARFLMTILPVLAPMAALMLDDLAQALAAGASPRQTRTAMAAATVLTVIAIPIALRKTVEHKTVLLRSPLLDSAGRHRVRIGGLYDLATAINGLPPGSRTAGVPSMIRFHLASDRLDSIDGTPVYGPPESVADRYDYVVYRIDPRAPLPWPTARPPVLRTADGYLLVQAQPSTPEPDEDARR